MSDRDSWERDSFLAWLNYKAKLYEKLLQFAPELAPHYRSHGL